MICSSRFCRVGGSSPTIEAHLEPLVLQDLLDRDVFGLAGCAARDEPGLEDCLRQLEPDTELTDRRQRSLSESALPSSRASAPLPTTLQPL